MSKNSHNCRSLFKDRCGVFIAAGLLIATALRIIVSCELANANMGFNAVFHPAKATDLATYMQLASEIASGNFPETFYYQPWYYTVFVPLILLTGAGIKGVISMQILAGCAAVFLAALSAWNISSKRGALFSALLAATSVPLIFYTPYHQNETLQSFHLILLFFAGFCALKKGKLSSATIAGAVSGAAIATRGNILLIFVLLEILLLIFPLELKLKKRLLNAAAAGFCALLVIIPFAVKNTVATGKLTGPSTAGDAVLALGNTPEAPPGGRNPGLPAGPMEYPEAFHRTMSDTSHGVGLGRAMFNWMCREPLAFFELQARKLLLFWDVREIPNNVSLAGDGKHSCVLAMLKYCGGEHLLLICGLAGLLLLGCTFKVRDFRLWWLGGFIVIYWFSIALFYNLSRFRAPILPVLAVAAAVLLRKNFRSRRKHLLAALLFAIFISCFAYDAYRLNEHLIMRAVRPDGTLVPPAIGKHHYDLLDHGPITFGAWKECRLASGMTLRKKFACNAPGEVIWKIFAETNGILIIRNTDGKELSFELAQGENSVTIPCTSSDTGFTVLYASGNCCAVCDMQRDYSRSSLDGKILSAEWVARYRFRLDKADKDSYNISK